MAAKCRKFEPNVFNKTKCGICFKSRNDHSASALESAKAARKLLKYGYLFIAPDISARRWQRRFFVLYDDGELSYAVDENVDTVPQGVIDMNMCEDVFDAELSSGHEFSFGVTVPPDTHYIKGTSREEAVRWMELLMVYPTENAQTRSQKPRPTQSQSAEEISQHKEPSPDRQIPSDSRSRHQNGNPVLTRSRTKSVPQLPVNEESDDELQDKFLKEDWYKPINNNQSSLGNLNIQNNGPTSQKPPRRHTELNLTSGSFSSGDKPSLSSRVSTGSLGDNKRLLSKDRRKTQPEIRYNDSDVPVPEVTNTNSLGRRRTGTDSAREVGVLRGAQEGAPGAPGGPPPVDKRRRRPSTDIKEEPEESKVTKVSPDQPSRTSQCSTDSESQIYMKKGWLHKLTPTGEWSKHWFVLCGQALKYYRDSRAEEINDLDGRIDLKYCLEVREADVSKNYGMTIKNRNSTYTLSAMTSGIRSNWIHALSKYVPDDVTTPQTDVTEHSKVAEPRKSPEMSTTSSRRRVERMDSNSSVKDRSQLVVEGRPSPDSHSRVRNEDARSRLSSAGSDVSDRSGKSGKDDHLLVKREQDPKMTGKSPIEKKLDKLRSKVVSRTRSPPPKLASEVLKKAAESPDHGAVVHMLESEVDHLQSQLEKAHDEMVSMHDENSRLKSKFKHAKKKIKEVEESTHQVSSYEDQLRDLRAESAANNNEKSLLKLELENVRSENDLLQVKVRKLNEESSTLKRSFQAVTNENAVIRNEMKNLQSQMAKLQEANSGKHDELTELVQKVDEYRTESRKHKKSCREKESQILEISEELQHKCEDYEDLLRKYNLVLNEMDKNQNLKSTSVKLERDMNNLRQELDQKNEDYSDVMNRYNELASEYQNLKSSLEGTKKVTSNYVSNLKEHETLIKNLRQELENRTIDLAANEKLKVAMENELKDSKMALKDSLHILDSQKSRVDEKDKQIQEQKKYLEERNKEHDELVNKYEDLLSKYNALVKSSENSDQKDEITKLNDLLDEKMHSLHELEDKYNDLVCEFEKTHDMSLLDQLDDREEEVEKLKDELHERALDCEELALRVDQLERELANTRMTLMEHQHQSGKTASTVDVACGDGLIMADLDSETSESCDFCVQVDVQVCTSSAQTLAVVSACPACSIEFSYPLKNTQTQTLNHDFQPQQVEQSEIEPINAELVEKEPEIVEEPIEESVVPKTSSPFSDLPLENANSLEKLKTQLHLVERQRDEMDVRNSALKLRINQMIDRYNEETKFYSAKIDDLVTKLRNEQGHKKDGIEQLLTGIEKQIKGAEQAMQAQASVEDTLAQGLSLMLESEDSDTCSERTVSPQPEMTSHEPIVTSREEENVVTSLEEEHDDELLTRIQGLHNRVLVSNEKLTQLFSLIQTKDDDSESSLDCKLKSFEDRLTSIHDQIREQETTAATTESLKNVVQNHDLTLSVLDECETGLLTSLSSLNKTEQRREKLQAVVETVNDMMEFANKEREVILANKKQIVEALTLRERKMLAFQELENISLKSVVSDAFSKSQEDEYVSERDKYLHELQEATSRIAELEETVDVLRSRYSQSAHNDVILNLSDAVETYASVIAEGVVHHGMTEVSRKSLFRERFCERDGFLREIRVQNSKIRELENTVEVQLTDREKLIRAESFNHYVSLIAQQTDHHDTMFRDYQRTMLDVRDQQLNEFNQFNERMKSIEDKIGTLLLGGVAPSVEAPPSGEERNEDWSVFSQAAGLVGKAMGQAELVLKLHQLRDSILACTSKQDQLRLFNQEIDLSLSRLRSREKLMTDSVDKYKSGRLDNVSDLVVTRGIENMTLTQALRSLINKLNHLVSELSSFYKSMDMAGDQANVHSKLDACIHKEVELAGSELETKCQGKRRGEVKVEPLTPEMLSSLLYNLADLLAQRAMVEAQYQHILDIHSDQKNYILPVSREGSRPASALSNPELEEAQPIPTRVKREPIKIEAAEIAIPVQQSYGAEQILKTEGPEEIILETPLEHTSSQSLPLPLSDRRHSDVLETSVVCSSPAAHSQTTTSSESTTETETETSDSDSETESDTIDLHQKDTPVTDTKVVTEMKVDLQLEEPVEMLPSSAKFESIKITDEFIDDDIKGDENSVFSGDELDRDTPDVFKFLHDPDFASGLRDPDVEIQITAPEMEPVRRQDRCASESDLLDSESTFEILDYSGNTAFSSVPNNLDQVDGNTPVKTRSKSLPQTEQPSVYKSTLASRMRAAEAKTTALKLHRSPAFRRRMRPSETSDSNPDLSSPRSKQPEITSPAKPKQKPPSPKPKVTSAAASPSSKTSSRVTRRPSTPETSPTKKLQRRGSTPEFPSKTPVRIPHSETRKVFVKSLKKPPPLKRGSPPKLSSPKKQEDRFVVSFGLSRGPVPEPSNNIF